MSEFDKSKVSIPDSELFIKGMVYNHNMKEAIDENAVVINITKNVEDAVLEYSIMDCILDGSFIKQLKVYFVVNKKNKKVAMQYEEHDNVTLLSKSTDEYIQCLAKSKYIISDSLLPTYYIRRQEQVYVNTFTLDGTGLNETSRDVAKKRSRILACNFLVTNSNQVTEATRAYYKLDGIYSGNIIENQGKATQEFAKRIVECIFVDGKVACDDLIKTESNRQNLLFVIDEAIKCKEELNTLALIQSVDFEKYNVIIYTTKPSDELYYSFPDNLYPNVCIIEKCGRVNYSEESYIQLQRIRHEFIYSEDLEAVLAHVPTAEFLDEWNKILPNVSISNLFLYSTKVFWLVMAHLYEKCNKKTLLCYKELPDFKIGQNNSFYAQNLFRMMHNFDTVYTYSYKDMASFREVAEDMTLDVRLIDSRYLLWKSYKAMDRVTINNIPYLVYDERRISTHLEQVDVFLDPSSKNKALFVKVDSNVENAETTIYSIIRKNLLEQDDMIIYLQTDAEIFVEEQLKGKVVVLDELMQCEELMRRMNGFIEFVDSGRTGYAQYLAALYDKDFLSVCIEEEYSELEEKIAEVLNGTSVLSKCQDTIKWKNKGKELMYSLVDK